MFNYVKSIQELVTGKGGEAPYLISIGERAEAVILAYQERQATTQQTLAHLEDLIREINAAEVEWTKMNLPGAAFAVYWTLHREKRPNAREAAERMAEVFAQYPHYLVSEEQKRVVRTELYKVLLQDQSPKKTKTAKEPGPSYDVKGLVEQILKVVEQAEQ